MSNDKQAAMNEFPILDPASGIPLFYPEVPREAIDEVADTLSGRWIGQGPKVDKFEQLFKNKFLNDHEPLAVGSGTDALHLAYLLAGLKSGDEVIVPVFTCTATNIPLLYIGAKPVFVDIDPETLNICATDIRRKITPLTKAIVTVDYGGICCAYDEIRAIAKEYNIPIIQDAAHSIGSTYSGMSVGSFSDFTIFSFQAIKTLTTGDGGLLAIRDHSLCSLAKKIRWFGIDREKKQGGIWENDIIDIGYKYQMTDIAASIGLISLNQIDKTIEHRKQLYARYVARLMHFNGLRVVNSYDERENEFCPWLLTVIVESDRIKLMKKLRDAGIESSQVHYRNDRYKIFGERRKDLPQMDLLEDRYLVLPLHTKMTVNDVDKICDVILAGW